MTDRNSIPLADPIWDDPGDSQQERCADGAIRRCIVATVQNHAGDFDLAGLIDRVAAIMDTDREIVRDLVWHELDMRTLKLNRNWKLDAS